MLPTENAIRRTLFFCLFFLLVGAAGAAPKPKNTKPLGIPAPKPGTVAGGPCAYLDSPEYAGQLGGADPESPVFHPNGDFAWNGRCGTDDKQRQMVCVEGTNGPKKVGTCKICGEPGPGDNPALLTYRGCPPKGKDCPEGMLLWPNGKCWDSNRGLPSWECEADCAHHYNTEGWCSHGGAWWTWLTGVNPDVPKNPSYSKPICAAANSCAHSGLDCAAKGQACQPDTGKCIAECSPKVTCQKAGYPEGFQCFSGDTCRLKP